MGKRCGKPLGQCDGFRPPHLNETEVAYSNTDIFYLEVCIFNQLCTNGDDLFSLTGQDFVCNFSEARYWELISLLQTAPTQLPPAPCDQYTTVNQPTDDQLQCYAQSYPNLRHMFCSDGLENCSYPELRRHWIHHGECSGLSLGCSPCLPNEPSEEQLHCYARNNSDLKQGYCKGDLAHCSYEGLRFHWVQHGKCEGRELGC